MKNTDLPPTPTFFVVRPSFSSCATTLLTTGENLLIGYNTQGFGYFPGSQRNHRKNKATTLNKKDEKNKLSKRFEATEEVILSKKEYGKRKRADGFDDALVGLVNSLNNSDATGQEAVVERKLMDWLTSNGKTSEDLLKEANVMEGSDAHDISLALLNELGIDTLINIYCAKGNSFEPKEFKSSLRDLGFPPLVYHKIYKVISQWMEMVTSSKETPSSGNDDFRIRATLTESSSSGDNFEITDEGETDRLVY